MSDASKYLVVLLLAAKYAVTSIRSSQLIQKSTEIIDVCMSHNLERPPPPSAKAQQPRQPRQPHETYCAGKPLTAAAVGSSA
jgi:hypothetical protein